MPTPVSGRGRLALFALLLLSTSQRVTPSVAAGIVREHLRLTSSSFGLLAGMSAFAFGLSQFPGGYLSDLLGAARLVKVAAVVSAAATLCFLFSPDYVLALAGRLVFGVSDSFIFVGMMRFAVGFKGGGALQIGKVQAIVGAAFAATGIVALGLTPTSFPLLFGTLAAVQMVVALALQVQSPGAAARTVPPRLSELAEIAASRQFWASLLANTGLFAPFLAWTSAWALPYLVAVVRLTDDQARLVIVADSLAAAAGALALGSISDSVRRRRRLLLLGSAAMSATWAVLLILGSAPPALIAVLVTLAIGFSFPACNSSLALAKESFRADRAGTVLGASNMASSSAAAVLVALAGLVLDSGWQGAYAHGVRAYPATAYAAIPAVLLAGSLLAVLGALLARETHAVQAGLPAGA